MTTISTLKTQAKRLVRSLTAQGTSLSIAQALECVAAQYGFNNWDTLTGVAKNEAKRDIPERAHTLADVTFLPERIWVESGPRRINCAVEFYDEDGLRLLHSPAELDAYFDANEASCGLRLATVALALEGAGYSFEFTFGELMGLTMQMLGGKPTWHAPKIDTYLEIEGWSPKKQRSTSKIAVLEVSALGFSLVTVPSSDEAIYDAHVIVPAHLEGQEVADQLSAEIARLRVADPDYSETTLVAFAQTLGCKWVVNAAIANTTWD